MPFFRKSNSRLGSPHTAFALLIAISFAIPARAATPSEVQKSIDAGIQYLYKEQTEGNWERLKHPNSTKWSADGGQWTGLTALVTLTLISAGENTRDPRIVEAINFLKKNQTQGVYALGMRCQLWAMLAQTEDVRSQAQRDVGLLVQSAKQSGDGTGLHGYLVQDPEWFDNSASQYAVLGIFACANSKVDLGGSKKYWETADRAWRTHQLPDGGWCYKPVPGETGSTITMTVAGVGTLYMAQDVLRTAESGGCKGNAVDESIEKGVKWMSDHFDLISNSAHHDDFTLNFYAMYGMERIGVASGRRFFGNLDWYQKGAQIIVAAQDKVRGSWSDICDTSFAILFLVHGRQPVGFSKLHYENLVDPAAQTQPDVAAGGPTTRPDTTNWNQRPRDAANLTRWIGRQTERELNWQIVNLDVGIDELHDSQILYLAGNQRINLKEEHVNKLRQFVEEGGLILGNADCGSEAFAKSVQELGKKLFPLYDWRELPANHPIYTEMQFPRSKWKNPPSILGISNGARELMILYPQADPARSWQTQLYGGKEELMQSGSNIFLYSAERQNLRYKGDTYIVRRDASVPTKETVRIARLQYEGNWDPEPGGWRRMVNYMHNTEGTDLEVVPVKLGNRDLNSTFKLAVLTGTGKFKLSEPGRAEIRRFLEAGGKLVVDACGGSPEFAAAAEAELSAIVPGVKAPFTALPKAHPAFSKFEEVIMRKFTVTRMGKGAPPLPRGIEKGRRIGIFYSPMDISCGLVGNPIDGIAGYDPDVATSMMNGIIQYSLKK